MNIFRSRVDGNIFRSRVDVFEAINRCDWQKVKDAVIPGKVSRRIKRWRLARSVDKLLTDMDLAVRSTGSLAFVASAVAQNVL